MSTIFFDPEKHMAKCEICGKANQFGHNVSHSNRKTPAVWKANVKKLRVTENGKVSNKQVCTRCIRSGKIQKAI
jgi:large subunit ribosomal protein L28